LATTTRDALGASGLHESNYIGSQELYGRADLVGLNLAQYPAILIELGNMKNADDATQIESPDGRAKYAAAVTDGITNYLNHPSIWRRPITLNTGDQPPAEFSDQKVSGLAGAVQRLDCLRSLWKSWRLGDVESRGTAVGRRIPKKVVDPQITQHSLATDLDTEHGGTDANKRDGARQVGQLNVAGLQL
jgi:hypothetical protein